MRHHRPVALGLTVVLAGPCAGACGSDDKPGEQAAHRLQRPLRVVGQADPGAVPDRPPGSRSRCATPTAPRWPRSCWRRGPKSPADVFLVPGRGALGRGGQAGSLRPAPGRRAGQVPATTARRRPMGRRHRSVAGAGLQRRPWCPRPSCRVRVRADRAEVARARSASRPPTPRSRPSSPRCGSRTGDERAKQFLVDLKANGAQIRDNNVLIVQDVQDGKLAAGLVNHYYVFAKAKELGTGIDGSRPSCTSSPTATSVRW